MDNVITSSQTYLMMNSSKKTKLLFSLFIYPRSPFSRFLNFALQGVNLIMKVWDLDPQNTVFTQDQVDEFNYDLTDVQGSDPRLLTIDGIRPANKTR